MTPRRLAVAATLLLCLGLPARPAAAQEAPRYGERLEGFAYPHPSQEFRFASQRQELAMSFMDIRPQGTANGRTALLLHGKNFCGATWEDTIAALSAAGWRVVVPDQVGFCRSSKPAAYQFTLHQLAHNTRALLQSLGIERATVIGHSMGGMLAARFALLYPESTAALVMVNPIGLEDWEAEGVPHRTVDQWLEDEQRANAQGMRAYQQSTYYAGHWEPRYNRWVEMQAGLYVGPGRDAVMWNQALTSDMVFTQPVVGDFPRIRVPTLLMIGEKDNTAIGKAQAPEAVRARIGNYAALGPRTQAAIPGARLVRFPELGHSPQVQEPALFNTRLLLELNSLE
jgi:pimeloyl-ACP methyl ester carboxylesterase